MGRHVPRNLRAECQRRLGAAADVVETTLQQAIATNHQQGTKRWEMRATLALHSLRARTTRTERWRPSVALSRTNRLPAMSWRHGRRLPSSGSATGLLLAPFGSRTRKGGFAAIVC